MEEAPDNGKDLIHSAHANGMNGFTPSTILLILSFHLYKGSLNGVPLYLSEQNFAFYPRVYTVN